ncbi:Tripartite DNA replication factor [Geranomyces variabilis]|nr:Tripartite DNA replication factor [Geranomyces variabilis]
MADQSSPRTKRILSRAIQDDRRKKQRSADTVAAATPVQAGIENEPREASTLSLDDELQELLVSVKGLPVDALGVVRQLLQLRPERLATFNRALACGGDGEDAGSSSTAHKAADSRRDSGSRSTFASGSASGGRGALNSGDLPMRHDRLAQSYQPSKHVLEVKAADAPLPSIVQAIQSWLSGQTFTGDGAQRDSNTKVLEVSAAGFSECRKILQEVRGSYGHLEAQRLLAKATPTFIQMLDEQRSIAKEQGFCLLLSLLNHHPQVALLQPQKFRAAYERVNYDKDQLLAVTTDKDTPLLINAGPGTGKTNTLVGRILYLLSVGVLPHQLIVITFTRKAAEALVDRCGQLRGEDRPLFLPFVKTIDALAAFFCNVFVRSDYPTIMNEEAYIAEVVKRLAGVHALSATDCEELGAELGVFYRKMRRGGFLRREEIRVGLKQIHDDLWDDGYCTHRVRLIIAVTHLVCHPYLGQEFRERFYLLVDEYQDVDPWQVNFIMRLVMGGDVNGKGPAESWRRITVVGDDDQSIYEFRGADPALMESFQKHLKIDQHGMRFVTLGTNYRTIQPIIDFNASVVKSVAGRLKANAPPFRARTPTENRPISCPCIGLCYETSLDEACQHTFAAITALHIIHNVPLGDVAVLAYRNDECARFTDLCATSDSLTGSNLLVSTIHGAKGLERAHIFVIIAIKNGVVCSSNLERRLIYVAFTRAKFTLHVTFFETRQLCTTWTDLLQGVIGSQSRHFPIPMCIQRADDDCVGLTDGEDRLPAAEQPHQANAVATVPTQDSDLTLLMSHTLEQLDEPFYFSLTPTSLFSVPSLPMDASLPLEEAPPTHLLNATKIAGHFWRKCPRELHRAALLKMAPRRLEPKTSDVGTLLMESGDRWEKIIVDSLRRFNVLVSEQETVATEEDLIHLLRTVPHGHYIYEPPITIPPSVCYRIGLATPGAGIQPYIKTIKPDFLYVVQTATGRTIRVMDAKYSDHAKPYQKVQIALYHMILDAMVCNASDIHVEGKGVIWLPGNDRGLLNSVDSQSVPSPQKLGDQSMCELLGIVTALKAFFRDQLPAILGPAGEKDYHLTAECSGCQHLEGCYAEATRTNDVCLVPGLGRQHKYLMKSSGINDIEDLVRGAGDDIFDMASIKARAAQNMRAYALGRTSHRIPRNENRTLIIHIIQDVVDLSPAVFGYVHYIGDELKAANEFVDTSITDVTSFVMELYDIMVAAEQQKSALQVWLGEASERSVLARLLIETPSQLLGREAQARDLVISICCADEAINAGSTVDRNPIFASRAFCLLPVVKELIAMPIDISCMNELHSVLVATNAGRQDHILARQAWDKVLLAIHVDRQSGPLSNTWKQTMKQHLQASYRTLKAFRALVPDNLAMEDRPFTFGLSNGITNSTLAKLVYQCQADAMAEYQDLVAERMTASNLMLVTPTASSFSGGKSFPALIISDTVDGRITMEPDPFVQFFVAHKENREDLLHIKDLAFYDWITPQEVNKRWDLGRIRAATVHHLDLEGHTVMVNFGSVQPHFSWTVDDPKPVFIIARRYINATMHSAIKHIKELDAAMYVFSDISIRQRQPLLLKLLQGSAVLHKISLHCPPAGWWPLTADGALEVIGAKKVSLTPQHHAIISAISKHSVQLLIGPPGTGAYNLIAKLAIGKTFFLAALILSRIHQATLHQGCRKQIILLTAWTHSAIDNVIDKMLTHMSGSQPNFIVRLTSARAATTNTSISYLQPHQTRKWLAAKKHCVICGSVWQLNKARDIITSVTGADIMLCVEESSLMPIMEASLVLSLLPNEPKTASLLMIGDHLQIGTLTRSRGLLTRSTNASLFNFLVERELGDLTPVCLTATWRLNYVAASILRRFVGYTSYAPATTEIGQQNIGQLLKSGLQSATVLDTYCADCSPALAAVYRTLIEPKKPLMLVILRDSLKQGDIAQVETKLAANMGRLLAALASSGATNVLQILFMVTHHRKRLGLQQEYAKWSSTPPEINTIHKAQGKETDVALILYAVSDLQQASAEARFLYDRKLLNVALSRGRRKAVLIVSEHLINCLDAIGNEETMEGFHFLNLLARETRRRNTCFEVQCEDVMGAVAVREAAHMTL